MLVGVIQSINADIHKLEGFSMRLAFVGKNVTSRQIWRSYWVGQAGSSATHLRCERVTVDICDLLTSLRTASHIKI